MLMEQECGEFAIEMWDPNWVCGMTNGDESREVKLAVFVEFVDMLDINPDYSEDDKYHYMVSAHIVVHPDSLTEKGKSQVISEGADRVYISDLRNNCGGILLQHDWCRGMNEDWNGIDYEEIETNEKYLFASYDDAEKFVNRILKTRLNGVMGMVGFLLDERINAIGSTGWT